MSFPFLYFSTKFIRLIFHFYYFKIWDFKRWKSQPVKDYYVFGTPTMYLLDENRKIILRPNSVKQMDSWVDWFLVKGNKS